MFKYNEKLNLYQLKINDDIIYCKDLKNAKKTLEAYFNHLEKIRNGKKLELASYNVLK